MKQNVFAKSNIFTGDGDTLAVAGNITAGPKPLRSPKQVSKRVSRKPLELEYSTEGVRPADPSLLGYPPTLPVEIAMHISPVREICEAYGITRDQWELIKRDPLFLSAYKNAKQELAKDGAGFRMKAKLQAEELLSEVWSVVHDNSVPHNVRADLIKSVVRWAGYDVAPVAGGPGTGTGFSININFSGDTLKGRVIDAK